MTAALGAMSMSGQTRFVASVRVARERRRVLEAARLWIGTPFHHDQRVRGVGVDCAQLLVAVYCDETGLVDRPALERYPRDWYVHERGSDRLLDVIRRACVPTSTPAPGDIAVFRFGRAIAHAAIVLNPPYILHAEAMTGSVYEDRCDVNDALYTRLEGYWTLRRWQEGAHV